MEIFLTIRADNTLLALAAKLIGIGQQIITKEDKIMSTLQESVDAIAAETTSLGSLIALISSLQAQVAATGLTSDQQAQVDTIFANATKNAAAITAAMAINVPAAPPPTVVPPLVP
jgi:hypothetical protein